MTTTRRQFVQALGASAALGAFHPFAANAQVDQVKVYFGFPAGSSGDTVARRVAEKWAGSAFSKNPGVVENKPGAGGRIALETLKAAPADGSVLAVAQVSALANYPHIYSKMNYTDKDFAPVSIAAIMHHGLAVGPMVPASVKNVKDFLAWAKANPTKANYGSPGAGSMPHLIVGLLNKLTGSDLKHIPYRGSAPGIQDLLGGQISAMSSPVGDYLPYLKSGRLRLLAISGTNRSPFVPDVPTYRQQGYPITVREWYGVFLPGKASPAVVSRAAAYLQPALAQPDLISSMAQVGMEVQSSSPQVLGDLLRADAEEWRRLIKQIGFTAES